MNILRSRARLCSRLRSFFDERDYLEVDTPLLSHDIVVDAHLDPLTVGIGDDTLFLQTSPEASMKRLLAAGCGNIYQITRSFRSGEQGGLHNPEFTIVEWYELHSDLDQQIALTESLVRHAFSGTAVCLPMTGFRITTYRNAFLRRLSIDPLTATYDELVDAAGPLCNNSNSVPNDRDDLLNLLLAEFIEPHLGTDGPEFLIDYPASQAALAQTDTRDATVARRFELYIEGIELCNGYQELTDGDVLRQRDDEQNRKRIERGANRLPGAVRMLGAMDHGLPECSGVALGFDRLLMILTGAARLDDVLPFPLDRA